MHDYSAHHPPVQVLVIDDDPLLRRVLRNALERGGFAVTAAAFEPPPGSGPFDIGVIDLHLEHRDGVDLAQRLMDEQVVRNTVFFTGSVEEGELARAASVGTVVEKTDPSVLFRTVEAMSQKVARPGEASP